MSKVSRKSGTCKWFDRKKGYGFIETEGEKDVFVHQTQLKVEGFRALYPEQEVEFFIQESGPNGRPCAVEVTAVGGDILPAAVRTARIKNPATRTRGKARPDRRKGRGSLNAAFVFIKPHAVTDKVKELVESEFTKLGITITQQGTLTAEEIDSKKLIDQHYYAIASKATILKPKDLAVPADKFKEKFGLEWAAALESGKVFNAMDGCKELGVDAAKLDELWAQAKKDKKLVKFGGGFYCGLVENGGKALYIFNGFFMQMRSKFTAPGTSIYYYAVEWPVDKLAWTKFRSEVLGPTDPVDAPADSLRGQVLARWQELGLSAQPNVGDNGVHASASPFEAMSERLNWLGMDVKADGFGRALIQAGVSPETISDYCVDPQVPLPPNGEEKGSLFDALEDLDFKECVSTTAQITKLFKA